MKNTKQKEWILGAVLSANNHPTADEIYTTLKKENERLSLGTVYRNLNTFAQKGEIKKISVPGLGDRFDHRLDDHEHFLCDSCGRVFDADVRVEITPRDEEISLTGYTLMLHGVCPRCRDKKERERVM